MADSAYKGPLCQERDGRSELKPGRLTADQGRQRAEPARPQLNGKMGTGYSMNQIDANYSSLTP